MPVTALAPLWTEVTSWLAANASGTLAALRPPADPARLDAAEAELGFRLGSQLTEWWHLHDGVTSESGSIVPGYYLLSVDGMLDERQGGIDAGPVGDPTQDPRQESDRACDPTWSFLPRFVPVGYDGAGNSLVVDCRPGARHGYLKDYDHEDGAHRPPLYKSLADLLTQVLHSLHTGDPLKQRRPVIQAGTLNWDWQT
jgi:cell wall assembly regulator SMI1